MDARHEQGLEFGVFALSSYSEQSGEWTNSPMSSSEITYIIRELLQDAAHGADLKQLGSHSSKVTLLTWAGRSSEVQFNHPERRLLGHHLDPGARSMMTYSREAYTSLYSKVLAMIKRSSLGASTQIYLRWHALKSNAIYCVLFWAFHYGPEHSQTVGSQIHLEPPLVRSGDNALRL